MRAGDAAPDVRGVIVWCVFTWLAATVGAVLCILSGNWVGVLFAVNSAMLAAGWWLACDRWASWRAIALAAYKLTERRDHGNP